MSQPTSPRPSVRPGKPAGQPAKQDETKPVAPAQKATPAPAVKPEPKSAVDFGALTIVDAEAPARTSTRTAKPNPFLPAVQASWDQREKGATKGKGKATPPISKEAQVEATNLIRYAAAKLGLGAAIAVDDAGNGKIVIRFCAKVRKQKREKTTTTNTSETTPVDGQK